jgi:four helix bundle protein
MKNEGLQKKRDIVERTFNFSIEIIKLISLLPKNSLGFALTNQIVRSGTSIGANVEEAQGAISKKEFIQRMQIALKEARETRYWIRIIIETKLAKEAAVNNILDENNQLLGILSTIVKNAKNN